MSIGIRDPSFTTWYILQIAYISQSTSSVGHEPWSSGYGWQLMFERLRVRIPALYTGWTFFHIDLLQKIVLFVWEDQKYMKKRPGLVHFLKTKRHFTKYVCYTIFYEVIIDKLIWSIRNSDTLSQLIKSTNFTLWVT